MVTENEWQNFKENEVTRVFKEGFSVSKIEGAWKDTTTKKLITEPTYQVIYYYRKSRFISTQIDSLRSRYQRLFEQQSVLRVDRKVKLRF